MNRLGTGGARGANDGLDVEITLGRRRRTDAHSLVGLTHMTRGCIRVGINGNRADTHPAGSAEDAAGDLATVGHEEAADHVCHGCR